MTRRLMCIAVAIILGLALSLCQLSHGGALVPFLAVPAYFALLVAGAAAIWVRRSTGAPPIRVLICFGLLSAYVVWRGLVSPDGELGRIDVGQALAYALAWLAIVVGVQGGSARLWMVGAILLTGLVQCGFAVFQATSSVESLLPFWLSEELRTMYFGRFPNRSRGLFLNPNQLAWTMNIVALLALGLGTWGRVRTIWRILLFYVATMFAATVVLTGSRGGMLSLFVGLLLYLLMSGSVVAFQLPSGKRALAIAGALVLCLVAGGGAITLSQSWVAQGRLDSILDPDLRTALAGHAVRLFQEAPAVGAGSGQFLYAARRYRDFGEHRDAVYAHNDWLQFAAEYGALGLVLLLGFLLLSFGGAIRAFWDCVRTSIETQGRPVSVRGGILIGALTAGSACVVHSAVDFNMHIPANGILASLIFGLMLVGSRGIRTENGVGQRLPGIIAKGFLFCGLLAMAGYLWMFGRTDYFGLLADNASRKGDAGAAIELAKRGLTFRDTDPGLNATLGSALFGYESSLQFLNDDSDFEDLVIDEPDDAAAGEIEAEAEIVPALSESERAALMDGAAEAFLVAVTGRSQERSLYVELTGVYSETQRLAEARASARSAIARDPFHGYTWLNFGDVLMSSGDSQGAVRAYTIGSVLSGGERNSLELEFLAEEAIDGVDEGTE